MGSQWEPRELRGPLWELTTALAHLLAGADLFMMMHPAAVKTLKELAKELMCGGLGEAVDAVDWESLKL